MSLTDNSGVEHSGLGVKRVDGRVDTQLGDGSRQHSGGVQVREGGGGGRVSQVIGRDVDGLDGGNGTLLGGGARKKCKSRLAVKSQKMQLTFALAYHPYRWKEWAGNRRQRGYDRARQTPRNRPG